MAGCSGPVCVPVQHPTKSCGQIRLQSSFFPLGRGWHWSALKQLFQQQQGTPDDNPNKARPGNEVISFPFSAGKLLPQGWVIWGEGRAGRLCGGSYSFHFLLIDSSFETNQILNKKKQVICLASCSEIQTRSIKSCLSHNVSTFPVLTSLLY